MMMENVLAMKTVALEVKVKVKYALPESEEELIPSKNSLRLGIITYWLASAPWVLPTLEAQDNFLLG